MASGGTCWPPSGRGSPRRSRSSAAARRSATRSAPRWWPPAWSATGCACGCSCAGATRRTASGSARRPAPIPGRSGWPRSSTRSAWYPRSTRRCARSSTARSTCSAPAASPTRSGRASTTPRWPRCPASARSISSWTARRCSVTCDDAGRSPEPPWEGRTHVSLDEIAWELYGLEPAEFTAARNAKAKEAKQDGDKELAAAITALGKPTMVGWLANQLIRQYPDEMHALLELGESLREATASLAGDQLKELSRQQRQVVHALVQQARGLASAAGHPASEDTARGVEETLHAAL